MKKPRNPDPSRAVHEEIARRILRFRELIAASRRSPSPANIHDLRVSIRRLAAAVALCRDIADDSRSRAARASIKKLITPLGRLRDLHVQRDIVALAGSARTPLIAGFLELLAKEIRRETGVARAAIRSFGMRPVDLFAQAAERIRAGGPRRAKVSRQALARMLRRRLAKADRCRERYLRTGKMRDFHALRMAYKHLRYFAELMAAAEPCVTRGEVERVHAVQRRMGVVHDMHLLGERLASSGGARAPDTGALRLMAQKENSLRASCDRTLARFTPFAKLQEILYE
ncbi:MAG TPA: CHAD domain-containing protein [bacterium]|nr:CHAD domain-containing protein [bacterium]